MTPDRVTPVLVVGGGLVGLSAALFLRQHGVASTVVERHATTSVLPRARGVNPRTMELFRSLGLEDAIRSTSSARVLAGNDGVVVMSSLSGEVLGEHSGPAVTGVGGDLSQFGPCGWCLCDQDELEPVLLAAARERGVDVLFETEVLGFDQDDRGVTATVRDRGGIGTVRASYLVAADGAAGQTRGRLGIAMTGPGTLGHYVNIYVRADLREALGDRRPLLCYVVNRQCVGALVPADNAYRWLLHVPVDPLVAGGRAADFDRSRCVALVRAAAGVPDLEVSVIAVSTWEAAARTAETFQVGRVFLTGDAAHVMPPTGAFGSNTGIQDAHNLAWRLAAVLSGGAGPGLLAGYDAERRPVARLTVDQAVRRSKARRRMSGGAGRPIAGTVPDSAVIFGQRYEATLGDAGDNGRSPITGHDVDAWEREPSGRPGTRAPHVPLTGDGRELSTIDLFGREFVLLCSPGRPWSELAREQVARVGVPMRVCPLGPDGRLRPVEGRWHSRFGVTESGAVLVRPDGIVAWRAPAAAPHASQELLRAMRRLLHVATDPTVTDRQGNQP